jgi:hypothetical protein
LKEADMLKDKAITLYLAEWQKRMIMDHISDVQAERLRKVKFIIDDPHHWVMYRPVTEIAVKGAWNFYLTDEQIHQVVEVTGIKTKISALNISPEMLESKAVVFE